MRLGPAGWKKAGERGEHPRSDRTRHRGAGYLPPETSGAGEEGGEGREGGRGGGCTHFMHSRSLSDHGPSHPDSAGTEQERFSPTWQTSCGLSAMLFEVLGESPRGEGVGSSGYW